MALKIDYEGHPKRPLTELLTTYRDHYLILDDVLATEDSYTEIYQDILDLMKYGFEYKNIREFPIRFIIHTDDPHDKKHIHTLQARHFLSNMILWYAFVDMESTEVMDESYIVDWTGKSIQFIADFIDNKILPYHTGDFHSKNKVVDEICYHITAISNAFCLLMGYSISCYDIMKAEEELPEIHNIIYGDLDVNMQPKEMEEELDRRAKRLIELFGQANSDLRPLLLSGKNISEGQFKEIFLRIAFKGDFDNRTMPGFIDANIMRTGINKPSYYYKIAVAGRRALLNTKLSMSQPGALSKKMNAAATSVQLRKDYEICNSTRPIYYNIPDDITLRMLDKRYYYTEDGEMKLLDYTKDKDLIGKTIAVRSPITCCSDDGCVCRACYGDLFDINKDLYSPGALAATKDSEPTTQLILKTKHVNTTSSSEISFTEGFDKAFELVSEEITLGEVVDDDTSKLYIQLGPMHTEETDDGDQYYVDYFDLVDDQGGIVYHIAEEHETPLYLTNEMYAIWKRSKLRPIPFDVIEEEADDGDFVLFKVEVKTKAITQHLQVITSILDQVDHAGCGNDIDAICNTLGQTMIDANIKYNFVHHEMIIRSLMRRKSNELEYPDFGPNGDHADFKVLRLTSTLSTNPAPLVRLSTGWLKKNLLSTSLYKSHAKSHLDALFVPNLLDVMEEK